MSGLAPLSEAGAGGISRLPAVVRDLSVYGAPPPPAYASAMSGASSCFMPTRW